MECKINRLQSNKGRCNSSNVMKIARIAPHYWEEPCLSGQNIEDDIKGSGTIFFCGCSLGCIFCQNRKISRNNDNIGKEYSIDELADAMISLQNEGVHNINLVTPTHFSYTIKEAIILAKEKGLSLPIVYNSSGYEKVESLENLNGLIDIYMPDFKYFSNELAKKYSKVTNYKEIALDAIKYMQKSTGKPIFDEKGFLKKGTIVRHLILPGNDFDSNKILNLLSENFEKDDIVLSLMSQYTPIGNFEYEELNEKISKNAYLRVISKAEKLGFKYIYTQDSESCDESFIPEFH